MTYIKWSGQKWKKAMLFKLNSFRFVLSNECLLIACHPVALFLFAFVVVTSQWHSLFVYPSTSPLLGPSNQRYKEKESEQTEKQPRETTSFTRGVYKLLTRET